MSLPNDLLTQAKSLAKNEPTRPRQASLRRAVSAAYYALFHLLVADAARQLSGARPQGLREKLQRAFVHSDMKTVCRQFVQQGNSPPAKLKMLLSPSLAPELVVVAKTFIDLQEARHAADYDVSTDLTKAEVLSQLEKTEAAFNAWQTIRKSMDARVFITALLINDRWNK